MTLVAPKSSVTKGFYRMGASLRVAHPPPGVKYVFRKSGFQIPPKFDQYQFSPETFTFWLVNALFDHLRTRFRGNLIHSFFWSYFNLWHPWIHENDSSLSQYLSGYFSKQSDKSNRFVRLAASILNANSCKKVIVWSEHAKNGMIDDGVVEEKVVVVPPPIPTRNRLSEQADRVTITFVGRDYERKGGDMVVRAFADLEKRQNVHLNYIGSIDDKGLRDYVKKNPNISYYEFLFNSDLHREVFPTTDLLVLPTRAEAFGLTVLEAMSYGIPVLASDLTVIKELLNGYSETCTFKRDDYHEFIEKLEFMVGNESVRKSVGLGLKRIVEDRYKPSVVNQKLAKVYNECL